MCERQIKVTFEVSLAWWAHVYLFIVLLNVRLGIPVDADAELRMYRLGVTVPLDRLGLTHETHRQHQWRADRSLLRRDESEKTSPRMIFETASPPVVDLQHLGVSMPRDIHHVQDIGAIFECRRNEPRSQ
jgi:hypothetical protein